MAAGDPPLTHPPAPAPETYEPSNTSWLDSVRSSMSYISAARHIPHGGEEGDILIIRNGEPTWVSPRDALGLRCSLQDGEILTREGFTTHFTVEPRAAKAPEPETPRPPPPPLAEPRRRTAWDRLLDED